MATTNLTNLKANALSNVVSTVLSTTGVSSVPKITTITYPGDDTAANTGGNQTISISGTGFNIGASVIVNGTPASVVSVVSPTSLTFTAPAQSSGTYTLYVVNTDGGTAIAVPGISYSGTPTWTTAAGSLATVYETDPVASVVDAAADVSVTYSLLSGTLPPGSSLNASTGLISGTSQATNSPTTYSFTIRATDGQNQDTDRAFSITINPDSVSWSSPADNSTTTVYEHSAISSISLVSTSAAGKSITYTANSLPTGITLTGNTISGTPTVTGTSYTQLTATAATTNRSATRNIGFVVNQDVVTWNSPADQYVTSLAQNSVMTTFNMDASSAAGKSITYTANSLPTGLSISGATIVGTPTVTGNSGSLITATAATTGRTATRTFNWVVSVLGDTYWPYNVLLLNGETPSIPFNADASTNAFPITVVGDTKPNYFNPYTPGYYSAYFDGTGDSLVINGNAGPIGTEDFTWECWAFISTMGGDYPRIFESNTGVTGSFQVYLSGGTLVVGGNGTGTITSYSIASLTNQWLHLCITRTGSAMRIFVNGVLRAYSASGGNNFPSGGSAWRTSNEGGGIIGYLSNMRVVRGSIVSAYSTSSTTTGTTIFTPSTSPLTAIAGTQFLGMQSSRFIDTSANAFAITVNGNTAVNSFQPFTPNSSYATYGSTYFDGTGDDLATPSSSAFAFGTGDFTAEGWVCITSAVGSTVGFWQNGTADSCNLERNTSGNLQAWDGAGRISTTPVPSNTWCHVAFCRSGATAKIFVNGVQALTWTSSVNYSASSTWNVGYTASGSYRMSGYISNVRVVKGTAVYTAAFTPSTTPLTAIANTSLLTCQYNQPNNNNLFLDSSSVTNIITRNGNVSQGTFSPYGDDWSNYFDGSGDYLTFTNTTSQGVNFGTGDFTVELWYYMTNNTTNSTYHTFIRQDTTSGAFDFGYRPSATQLVLGRNATGEVTASVTLVLNTWNHIAVSRSGTNLRFFVNGSQVGSTITNSYDFSVTGGTVRIGSSNFDGTHTVYGYISNLRCARSAVYTSNFSVSTTPLTAIANTSLLTCQSNRLIDNSPNNLAITKNGDTSVQRFSPFGNYTVTPTSYSNYFDGTGDYLSVPSNAAFQLGTGSYTFEAWIFPTALGVLNTNNIINIGTYITGLMLRVNGTTTGLQVYTNNTERLATSTGLVANTWQHIALVRNGSACTVYINGVVNGTFTDSSNISPATATLTIGMAAHNNSEFFTGYMSNYRLVKGTAVYTSAFTPPTAPLTAVANTSLLTCQSTTIIDNSNNAFAITAAGDVKPNRNNPFGYTTSALQSYDDVVHGGSAYFDGTGDYLTTTGSTAYTFGTGDFTVELWVYLTTLGSSYRQFAGAATTSAGFAFGLGGSNKLYITTSTNGTESSGTALVVGQWYHCAWTRSSGTVRMFLNGILDNTTAGLTTNITETGGAIGAASGGTYPMTGYISNLRVVKGTALYTSSFVPPPTPLTAITNSTLLLNSKPAILDYSMLNNLETVGNAQLSTQVKKYNNASMYFDGTGDSLKILDNPNINLGSGDFTLEFWVYFNVVNAQMTIINKGWNSSSAYASYLIWMQNDATLRFLASSTGGSWDIANEKVIGTMTAGTWTHIAVTRSGTTFRAFVNGVINNSFTFTSASSLANIAAQTLFIGDRTTGDTSLNGYIDDLRITKGYARYTSAFTPPTTTLDVK